MSEIFEKSSIPRAYILFSVLGHDLILELIEAGMTHGKIIKDYYPELTKEDIQASIHYAVSLIKEEEFVPFTSEAAK